MLLPFLMVNKDFQDFQNASELHVHTCVQYRLDCLESRRVRRTPDERRVLRRFVLVRRSGQSLVGLGEDAEPVATSGAESGDRVAGDGHRHGGKALPARRRRLLHVPLDHVRFEAVPRRLNDRCRFPLERDAVAKQVHVA